MGIFQIPPLKAPERRRAALTGRPVGRTARCAYFSVMSTLVIRMSCVGTLFSPLGLVVTGLVAILSRVSRLFESVTWPKMV